MLGFISRLFIQHRDDEHNPLIYLKLCLPYKETGVFKAGQSYMIRSQTKIGCLIKLQALQRLENFQFSIENPGPYDFVYANYPIWDHKKWYCYALSAYVASLTPLDEAFKYITDTDKQLSYLITKLIQIRPDYGEILSVQLISS